MHAENSNAARRGPYPRDGGLATKLLNISCDGGHKDAPASAYSICIALHNSGVDTSPLTTARLSLGRRASICVTPFGMSTCDVSIIRPNGSGWQRKIKHGLAQECEGMREVRHGVC